MDESRLDPFAHWIGATPSRRHFARFLAAAAAAAIPALPAAPPTAARPKKGEKSIMVSLSYQMLWAARGDDVVLTSYVSTGRVGFETPLGSYSVVTKLDSQTMEGVVGGEYYNVPDVPWVMYFTNWGHALHGTYWHSNFGTPMSHGCVNLPMDVAEWLYSWAEVGTPVHIGP